MNAPTQVALQLYSIRELVKRDFAGSIERVRAAGFTAIELYNVVAWKEDLAREMAANGLAAPTAHARLTEGGNDEIFEAAAELGVKTIIDPYVAPHRWSTAAQIAQTADELSAAAEKARVYGLEFGYHNHSWELENKVGEQTALEYLLHRLPAEASLEVDVYWAAIAGVDVPALLERLGSRVRFLHLKDAPLTDDGTLSKDLFHQVPLGEGALDAEAILAAAPSAELYVVEFDEYSGDVIAAAQRALQSLVARGAVA